MDQTSIYLISPISNEITNKNNLPKYSNFESHGIINHPQNQAEIKKEGPSVTQLFKSGNKKASFKPKTQQSQEINFLPLISNTPHDETEDQPLNDEIIHEQERFEQARLKQAPFIVAKSRFQRSGFPQFEQSNLEKGMEIEEIEEKKISSENDEDEADSYVDILDKLSDKNEGSFIQVEEEKVDLEESQVFNFSNGSIQESPIIEINHEMNEEKLDFNSLKSWNGDNEDQVPQCLDERIERNSNVITNGSLKDSNGNNEYSFLQDIEDEMNVKFNLNVNESFKLSGSFYEENSYWQQKSFHRPNGSNNGEFFFAFNEEPFIRDNTKA